MRMRGLSASAGAIEIRCRCPPASERGRLFLVDLQVQHIYSVLMSLRNKSKTGELPRPRGRPVDQEKRAAIVKAARRLFFSRGFEVVKVDEVALAAGVSKMTVYANFEDKTALFEAVVLAESKIMEAAISKIPKGSGAIAERFESFGRNLLGFLMSKEVMAIDKAIAAEVDRHPDLGLRFYAAGPGFVHSSLANAIAESVEAGELQVAKPESAADDLLSLWLGMVPTQHRFGLRVSVTRKAVAERVRHGVKMFMHEYGKQVVSISVNPGK